jgi:hypothetical protein
MLVKLRADLAALRRVAARDKANFIVRPPRDEYWDEVVEVFSIPRQTSLANARSMTHPRDGDLLAIADNGMGDIVAVRLSPPGRGRVVIVNHEHNLGTRSRVVELAPSLRAFVRGLAAETHELDQGASDEEFAELLEAITTGGTKGMMRVVNRSIRKRAAERRARQRAQGSRRK